MSIGGLFLPAVGRESVKMYLHHPSVHLHVVFNLKKKGTILFSHKQNSTPTFLHKFLFVKCSSMFRP
jgi:hypothetical protein